MLTEPPAAPTADIMTAIMTMPVTAPAVPAAAAAVAVRRGLRRLLHSPRPMAGSAAMTSKGARIGMTKEPMALNKPRPGTMAPSSRAVTATAKARAAATATNHKNRTGEYTQRRVAVRPGDASSPPAAVSPDLGFSGTNGSKGCELNVSARAFGSVGARANRSVQQAGHGDDHGPVDVGFVAGGQPFVVPDGPAVAGDPRQRPLPDTPAAQARLTDGAYVEHRGDGKEHC